MRLAFSTLACPEWKVPRIIGMATASGYEGIELRFVENEDSLWKLAAFRGEGLAATRNALADEGLTICCVDTSCRFHFPDPNERARWIDEGERMAELAAALQSPGIRVFGDTVQPGADRKSTRGWIAESMRTLADRIASAGVEVWLETHGDFARAAETADILEDAHRPGIGVIWDPANCYVEAGEHPREGAQELAAKIRHVHFKDLDIRGKDWKPALTGRGNFPSQDVLDALCDISYGGFVSFEWEKKWHPEIEDASIALPQFVRWFRESSQ
jgi:sugar phosphate isomerase/epimerase